MLYMELDADANTGLSIVQASLTIPAPAVLQSRGDDMDAPQVIEDRGPAVSDE